MVLEKWGGQMVRGQKGTVAAVVSCSWQRLLPRSAAELGDLYKGAENRRDIQYCTRWACILVADPGWPVLGDQTTWGVVILLLLTPDDDRGRVGGKVGSGCS